MSKYERESSIPLDTVYDLLSNPRRRMALSILADQDRKLTLNDLSKKVVTMEQNASITEISGEALERIHTSLHHWHVPKLADADVVAYDTNKRLIEPAENLADMKSYMDFDNRGGVTQKAERIDGC